MKSKGGHTVGKVKCRKHNGPPAFMTGSFPQRKSLRRNHNKLHSVRLLRKIFRKFERKAPILHTFYKWLVPHELGLCNHGRGGGICMTHTGPVVGKDVFIIPPMRSQYNANNSHKNGRRHRGEDREVETFCPGAFSRLKQRNVHGPQEGRKKTFAGSKEQGGGKDRRPRWTLHLAHGQAPTEKRPTSGEEVVVARPRGGGARNSRREGTVAIKD